MLAGITSVSVAAHKGREEIVKMLIAADADVNIDSNNGSTPLIQASHFGGSDGVFSTFILLRTIPSVRHFSNLFVILLVSGTINTCCAQEWVTVHSSISLRWVRWAVLFVHLDVAAYLYILFATFQTFNVVLHIRHYFTCFAQELEVRR